MLLPIARQPYTLTLTTDLLNPNTVGFVWEALWGLGA